LHNPEFTLLEWYRAKGDYQDMVADTEQLTVFLAKHINGKPMLDYRGQAIDLTTPWPEITVQESFVRFAGWNPVADADSLRFDLDLCDKVIPAFATKRPTVLLDYPAAMASLARLKPGEPQVAERAEVFLGGLEIANAYSELIDPGDQAKRFKQEIEQMEKGQGRQMPLPMRFLEAMPSMPECGGIALGIDRLVMLFCNAESIDEVIPFSIDTA
jgi:lysyl-tRNA synthetase class 2